MHVAATAYLSKCPMHESDSPLPRGPILDWSSFGIVDAPGISSVEDLPHTAFTTSGRAAIFQALLQLGISANSSVLVPTYHCPTMVAPVILANLKPAYFGLHPNGLPNLDTIDDATAKQCSAMIVSHYFGIARSLAVVRQWCDERGIALIEDCAHCYFGEAGVRPVGAWGDFSTASLSKFFPVSEGGLLASAYRPVSKLRLRKQSLKAQLKGWGDVLELATRHQRLAGINHVLALLIRLKNSRLTATKVNDQDSLSESSAESMMRYCDMSRIGQAPLWASTVLNAVLPRGRIIARRQQNFARYAGHFEYVQSARPLFPSNAAQTSHIAPYVFPLWVDDPDPVYQILRERNMPVFRWDRIWPGTPALKEDVGALWSHHVLQLLCHQDLNQADVDRTSRVILSLLPSDRVSAPALTH